MARPGVVGVCATAAAAERSAAPTRMAPTAASKTGNADPMAPDNPPGNHPIAAPITVVINGPMAPMTILWGDGSAILLPRSCRQLYAGACVVAMGTFLLPVSVRGLLGRRGQSFPPPPGDAHQIEDGDRPLLDPKHEKKRASYAGSICRFLNRAFRKRLLKTRGTSSRRLRRRAGLYSDSPPPGFGSGNRKGSITTSS